MILTVTPNPCVDKTVFIDALEPGAFIRSRRCTCIPGGKGTNVARAVHALGRAAKALVVVGGHPGAHVVEMIEQQDGVPCVPHWVEGQTRTITTVLEEPIHRQTAFFEPGSAVTPEEADALEACFAEHAQGARVVTLNGTVCDRGTLEDLYARLIPIAKDAGARVILDSHGPEFARGLDARPDMVKPNVPETEELVGYPLDTRAAQWRAVDALHARGVELVVLSLGKDGALVSRGAERFHAVPPRINEVNPVGSGDALVAGFAIGLAEDLPLRAAAALAIAAGAANALSWDIGHFTPAQVDALREDVRIVET